MLLLFIFSLSQKIGRWIEDNNWSFCEHPRRRLSAWPESTGCRVRARHLGFDKPSGWLCAQEVESLWPQWQRQSARPVQGRVLTGEAFTWFACTEHLGASIHLAPGMVALGLSGVAGPSGNSKGFQLHTFLHSLRRKPKKKNSQKYKKD